MRADNSNAEMRARKKDRRMFSPFRSDDFVHHQLYIIGHPGQGCQGVSHKYAELADARSS
jgi:hypothetical protein